MIRFFKWCIVRRKDWQNIERENDRLSNAVIVRDEQIERLNKRLDAIKKGKRCKEKHCASCVNACEVTVHEYNTAYGFREQIEVVCVLDATCPDFKMKEE